MLNCNIASLAYLKGQLIPSPPFRILLSFLDTRKVITTYCAVCFYICRLDLRSSTTMSLREVPSFSASSSQGFLQQKSLSSLVEPDPATTSSLSQHGRSSSTSIPSIQPPPPYASAYRLGSTFGASESTLVLASTAAERPKKKGLRERIANAIYRPEPTPPVPTVAVPVLISARDALVPSSVASSKVSTKTRVQLRTLELERDRLQSYASRLKKECEQGPSVMEAENRLLKLQIEELKAMKEASTKLTKVGSGSFKTACSTDLLFLMDTTGSMECYIQKAKEQVMSIVDDISRSTFNEAEVRVAVVGYKDHTDDPNIQFIDFTPDASKIPPFLETVKATGGDDTPEDVLGGCQKP